MTITLTSLERLLCGFVGLSRNASAREKNWSLEAGRKDIGLERDIIGAYGEFAVARAFNLNWNPVVGKLDTQRGDVGPIQVKTVLGDNDCLLIREHDPEDKNYVLCHLKDFTTIYLVGWIEGKNGKLEQYWKTTVHRPCFFVPRSALKPINQLPT